MKLNLLFAFLLSLTLCSCFEKKEEINAKSSEPELTKAKEELKLSQVGMAELASSDLAFRLDDVEVTWGELQDYFNFTKRVLPGPQSEGEELTNGMDLAQQKAAKNQLTAVLRRMILLREAKKLNPTVTAEDRNAFAERWNEANPTRTLESYLAQFPQVVDSPLRLSRDDMFLVLKYMDSQQESMEIPEAELKRSLEQLGKIKATFAQQQAQDRTDFAKIASMDGFQTDEGFAKLAKDFSDGVESDNGGLIATPMTREEIAECNDGQPFEVAVGYSSELIETQTSLRYIRVLEEIAPERVGEASKLKIAQILLTKRELDGIPTEEELRKKMKYQLQEIYFTEKIREVLKTTKFECPLFPHLPQEWPPKMPTLQTGK